MNRTEIVAEMISLASPLASFRQTVFLFGKHTIFSNNPWGIGCDIAVVLGNFLRRDVVLIWIKVRQGPTMLAECASWGYF